MIKKWTCRVHVYCAPIAGQFDPIRDEYLDRTLLNNSSLTIKSHGIVLRILLKMYTLLPNFTLHFKAPVSKLQYSLHVSKTTMDISGIDDHVRCFSCDGGLKRWDPDDTPWVEHCKWFPACPFARRTKGEAFIAMVQDTDNTIYDEVASSTMLYHNSLTPMMHEQLK